MSKNGAIRPKEIHEIKEKRRKIVKQKEHDVHSGHFMSSKLYDDDEDEDKQVVKIIENVRQNGKNKTLLTSSNRQKILSIDSSLTKLFDCMTLAYSAKLASPKFKAFKGMKKCSLKDKVRLNNIIWREWHQQYVTKKKPIVCQFSAPIHDDTHSKPESVVLEGKYWKRRLETVSEEYKKWRVFFKENLAKHDKELEEVVSHAELLDRVAQQDSFRLVQQSSPHSFSMEEDFPLDLADTLFSSLSQPFAFPSFTSRELSQLGNSDYMQPGLLQLQPSLDDYMDSTDPLQDFIPSSSMASEYQGMMNNHSPDNMGNGYLLDPALNQHYPHKVPVQKSYKENMAVVDLGPLQQPPYPYVTINTHPIQEVTSYSQGQGQLSQSGQYNSVISLLRADATQKPVNLTKGKSQIKQVEFAVPKEKPRKPRNIAPATSEMSSKTPAQSTVLGQLLTIGAIQNSNVKPLYRDSYPVSITANLTTLANTATLNLAEFRTPLLLPVTTACTVPRTVSEIIKEPTTTAVMTPNPYVDTQISIADTSNLTSPQRARSKNDERPGKDTHKRASHISAEQKRRCNIKSGFDMLYVLIPSLIQNPNAKISKAGMLQKTAEFCKKLKSERVQMQEEADVLKQEIEALNTSISACQMQLPATGAPVTRQRADQMRDMFDDYVQSRTQRNWKFYILSLIVQSLFDSYNNMVSTASPDELCRTVLAWLDQHCSLVSLRPVVLNALRQLSTTTSILSNPDALAEEAMNAVKTKRNPPDT